MDLHLEDKVAIVTGGSRGLGRAICRELAAEGVKVAINYRQNAEKAEALVAEIRAAHGAEALALEADVSKEADVQRMFRLAEERFSRIDVVVNNAGIWPTAYVKDMTEQQWNHTLAVNLSGPFLTSREAGRSWPVSCRTGGHVHRNS